MTDALRFAAPTAQTLPSQGDNSTTEGRADPHGIHWHREIPPYACKSYAGSGTPLDVTAASTPGAGRRATGLVLLASGTLSITDGSGNVEAFQSLTLPQGFNLTQEFISITCSGAYLVQW